MKKTFKTFFCALFAFLLLSFSAYAVNNVENIDISVYINEDGSADITQTWQGSFYEGTENYLPINTDGIEILNFSARDELGEYSFVDWDVDATFEEKMRKCGIVYTDDGVELCFGISEYGEKIYEFSYTVKDFIKAYTDYDGTNFMFVNPNMESFPTNVNIRILLREKEKLSEQNCAVWGFGFDGNVGFDENGVFAQTNSALSGSEKVILLLRLDKGLLSPKKAENFSFSKLEKKAMRGSDYNTSFGFEAIIAILVFALFSLIAVFAVISEIKRRRNIKKFIKSVPYNRDAPPFYDADEHDYLCKKFHLASEKSNIIGALLLSMINSGNIRVQTEETAGAFGRVKEETNIVLVCEPEGIYEKKLYSQIARAQGNDGVLQEKELEKYFAKHPEEFESFLQETEKSGEKKFILSKGYVSLPHPKISALSELGKQKLASLSGLKKYLEDFSLISERGVFEAEIWQDYMVYAMLFGIAERVQKQFGNVYPERVAEFDRYYGTNVIIAHSFGRTIYSSSYSALQAKRSQGGGGRASFGGGGGFSGGGIGGGSR